MLFAYLSQCSDDISFHTQSVDCGGVFQGCRKQFWIGQAEFASLNPNIVCETHCMRSMPMLGGSGGMPPQENFEELML